MSNKVTLKGFESRIFLETLLYMKIIRTECLPILDYAEGGLKAGMGENNVSQQDIIQQNIIKEILCHWEIL